MFLWWDNVLKLDGDSEKILQSTSTTELPQSEWTWCSPTTNLSQSLVWQQHKALTDCLNKAWQSFYSSHLTWQHCFSLIFQFKFQKSAVALSLYKFTKPGILYILLFLLCTFNSPSSFEDIINRINRNYQKNGCLWESKTCVSYYSKGHKVLVFDKQTLFGLTTVHPFNEDTVKF